MKPKRPHHYLLFIVPTVIVGFSTYPAQASDVRLESPDGRIAVTLSDSGDGITYSVERDRHILLSPSRASLKLQGVKEAAKIKKHVRRNGIKEHIESPFYRQRDFDIDYNSVVVSLDNGTEMEWRAFDTGVAYRYHAGKKSTPFVVEGETASFALAGDPVVYLPFSTNPEKPMAMAYQNIYTPAPLSSASGQLAFLPVTADYGDGLKLTLLESDLEAYPGMYVRADSVAGCLSGEFANYPSATDFYPWRMQEYVTGTTGHIAECKGRRAFPWRIMSITGDDREMPVNNLVYALASPSRLADTSWIKPGKVAWDWWNDWGLRGVDFEAGINTATYRHYIDFAAAHGIEYVVLDEGWYDPRTGDMLTVIDAIDLPALIEYGRRKGVDIVLWTVFNVLDRQLEEACRRYSDMGVKGFKVDFLDRDDQTAVEMTYRIADACARHKLFLDYHGIYKPTGINRTYPNVLNFEGVFGMEEVKWTDPTTDMPLYDVTFPYIRMMAGNVDYTPGAMRNASRESWRAVYSNPVSMGTRCHQLATYIVYDSPFTMLCDSPSAYKDEEECVDFITSLPVSFDSTRVVQGTMGESIVTLRGKDGKWYIGGMTNWDPREVELDFPFLEKGKKYRAVMMSDGINASKQAQDYLRSELDIDSTSKVKVRMAPGGGFAMIVEPVN